MPQVREFLADSRDAYQKALDYYTSIATFGDAPARIRTTQRRLDQVQAKLDEIEAREASTPEKILRGIGRILGEL